MSRKRKTEFNADPIRDMYEALVDSGFSTEQAFTITLAVVEATAAAQAEG